MRTIENGTRRVKGRVMATFGEWIRTTRRQRDLTASECAERAGVSLSVWSRWESDDVRRNGEPSTPRRESVIKIADGLGIDRSIALRAAGYLPSAVIIEGGEAHGLDGEGNRTDLTPEQARELIAAADTIKKLLGEKI